MNKSTDLSVVAGNYFAMSNKSKLRLWASAVLGQSQIAPVMAAEDMSALITVRIEIVGKGTLGANTLICAPNDKDMISEGVQDDLVEPAHQDEKAPLRKALTTMHSKLKARQRRKWKKAKDELSELKSQSVLNETPLDQDKVRELSKEIETLKALRETENKSFVRDLNRLWLKQMGGLEENVIKNSCSRPIMGWVVQGGFSYRVARNVGLGFVPALALGHWLKAQNKGNRFVLVREINSVQYRKAQLTVVVG